VQEVYQSFLFSAASDFRQFLKNADLWISSGLDWTNHLFIMLLTPMWGKAEMDCLAYRPEVSGSNPLPATG